MADSEKEREYASGFTIDKMENGWSLGWADRETQRWRNRFFFDLRSLVSTRGAAPCRRERVFDLNGARMSAAKVGAPLRERNGNYRHGRYTREAIELQREVRDQTRRLRAMLLADEWDW